MGHEEKTPTFLNLAK